MTRTTITVTILASAMAISIARAQQAAPPAQGATPAPAQGGRGGGGAGGGRGGNPGGGGPAANTANEAAGVNPDRFISSPMESRAHFSHGGLITRAILRPGNPLAPGEPGAVLEYRQLVATATLPAKNSTPLMKLPDQYLFYVTEGTGRLEDGKQFWDLHPNVATLIPPNVDRRFVNTSDAPLTMVMLQWVPSSPPRADILVRDVDKLGYCEENAHWANMSKCIFRNSDGLLGNERMFLVQLQPWTWSEPHTHTPGTEEIWVKLSPGNSVALLGSDLRDMPQYAAYLAPPTGFTMHGQLNLSKTNVEGWLYIARGPAPPATTAAPAANATAAGRGGGGGRGNPNPNLFTDQATIDGATVRGKPIN